jgi:hypothetical protein
MVSGGFWNMKLDHYNGVASSLFCVHSVSMHLINLSDQQQKILYSTKMQSNLGDIYYWVIHKSVKHFKNSQQIDYATDRGISYAERERNSPKFFLKKKPAHIVALICC